MVTIGCWTGLTAPGYEVGEGAWALLFACIGVSGFGSAYGGDRVSFLDSIGGSTSIALSLSVESFSAVCKNLRILSSVQRIECQRML